MSSDPDLSVVMAAYNNASTLEDQLAALSSQDTKQQWELVVADNGSTDATQSIIDAWADRIPDVRIIDASDQRGISHARNRAAAAARGEFLLFCDADDVVESDWITSLARAGRDADAVGGVCDVFALNTPVVRYWRGMDDRYPIRRTRVLPWAIGCNFLIRRSLFEHLGGFDEHFVGAGEDVDLSWRLQLEGYRLELADDAVVMYRLKNRVKAAGAQAYRYGRSEPSLYRRYRSIGKERRSFTTVLKSWAWLVVNAWRLIPRRERGRWMCVAGKNVGRIVGSFQQRTLCL